jgi:hypothetical protein
MADKRKRGRSSLPPGERKDRLIQTRVAEDLDEALKAAAKQKRVTVSQLIRNVLEDTFHLVDNIVSGTASLTEAVRRDARRIAASARGTPPAVTPADLEDVVAWQEVLVARETACARCHQTLRKGAKGMLGLREDPAAERPWLCPTCKP